MKLSDFQSHVERTLKHPSKDHLIALKQASMALGLAGEAGEVVDLMKKVLWHGNNFDRAKMTKELGDVLWYLTALGSTLGISLDEVAEANVKKLRARFPVGFTEADAQKRFEVTVECPGNPDYAQYAPVAPTARAVADSVAALVQFATAYRDANELSSGNFVAFIERDGERIADISYNGRLWSPNEERSELTPEQVEAL